MRMKGVKPSIFIPLMIGIYFTFFRQERMREIKKFDNFFDKSPRNSVKSLFNIKFED